jgi:hypothetical protein
MSDVNIPGFIDLKNRENTARWMLRSYLRGGSMHIRASDLEDLRNEDDLRRWRYVYDRLFQARRELKRATVLRFKMRAASARR